MVVGNGYGYGYGEEGGGPIIEQTSSSESHYELMALARLIADGLGVTDSEGEPPYLQQIRDGLAEIKGILQQSHDASEALRAEAQTVLEAHAESAQQYMQVVDQAMPPDLDPFVAMPTGTAVRDLPDGGRIFTLADGVMVRVGPDGRLTAIGMDGSVTPLEPARGGVVTLPDGRELMFKPEAVRVTHEAAGIEGLPLDIDPIQTAQGRCRVELPGGYRLDVFQPERTAMIGNPAGTSVVLGISRIEGVGEDFYPKAFDRELPDEIVQVNDAEAFEMTRRLAAEEGLLVGGSSGMAVTAALKYAREHDLDEDQLVVVLLPDSGRSYMEKIFNDDWMRANGFADVVERTSKPSLAERYL